MSKLQHTPGKWKVKQMFDNSVNVITQGDFVCTCGHQSNVGVYANARLIAAAPEMLEALIESCKFKRYINVCDSANCKNCQIDSIIKKATGMSIEEILK